MPALHALARFAISVAVVAATFVVVTVAASWTTFLLGTGVTFALGALATLAALAGGTRVTVRVRRHRTD